MAKWRVAVGCGGGVNGQVEWIWEAVEAHDGAVKDNGALVFSKGQTATVVYAPKAWLKVERVADDG